MPATRACSFRYSVAEGGVACSGAVFRGCFERALPRALSRVPTRAAARVQPEPSAGEYRAPRCIAPYFVHVYGQCLALSGAWTCAFVSTVEVRVCVCVCVCVRVCVFLTAYFYFTWRAMLSIISLGRWGVDSVVSVTRLSTATESRLSSPSI